MKRHLWTAGIVAAGAFWLLAFSAMDTFGNVGTFALGFAAFWAFSGTMVLGITLLAGRRPLRWMLAYTVVLLAVWLVPWNPQKQFVRDLHRIPLGASPAEARTALERWCKQGDGFRTVQFTDTSYTPISDPAQVREGYLVIPNVCAFRGTSWYDPEGSNGFGEVRFVGGKAVGVRFEADD